MRRVYTEADRERFFTDAARSGESLARFAQRQGLSVSTAYKWSRTRSEQGGVPFVQVVRNADAPVLAVLPGASRTCGVVVRVGPAHIDVQPDFDPVLLRAIVEALSGGKP